jgi:hypothetical protein
MPYVTERGVTSYYDRDTPPEFATGQDEDAERFNVNRDRAYQAAEEIFSVLDDLYSHPIPDKATEMAEIADTLWALVARVRQLSA